jgi:hypothetical protein
VSDHSRILVHPLAVAQFWSKAAYDELFFSVNSDTGALLAARQRKLRS